MNRSTSRTNSASPESRLFRAYWDDGLLDVLFGVGAVAVGLLWMVELVVFGAIVPAFLALAWNPLRRAIVEPRVGWVEFNAARTESNRRKLLAAVSIGLGALALVVVLVIAARSGNDLVPGDLAAALPAVLVGVMAGLIGVGLSLARFLGYALAFAAAGVLVALAGGEPGLAILLGGIVTLLSGAWLLTRFLRATEPIDEG
jgi:hypothetical protein